MHANTTETQVHPLYQRYIDARNAVAVHEAKEPDCHHPRFWGWWMKRNELLDWEARTRGDWMSKEAVLKEERDNLYAGLTEDSPECDWERAHELDLALGF